MDIVLLLVIMEQLKANVPDLADYIGQLQRTITDQCVIEQAEYDALKSLLTSIRVS